MMYLAARWVSGGSGPKLSVATVDHGLRPGARREADDVVASARSLGLEAVRLDWTGDKPQRGLPARARAARYGLLTDFARARGASHILTAHTLDDQAETVLMRFARGSGTLGLGGMRETVDLGGVVLTRPFLSVPKSELLAMCEAFGWRYVLDPTNRNMDFARTRWRRLAPSLAKEGVTAESIALLARRMTRADDALRQWATELSRDAALPPKEGARRFSMARLATYPDEMMVRILGGALVELTGREQPKLKGLEALAADLAVAFSANRTLRRTFHYVTLTLTPDGLLELGPEAPRRRGMRHPVQHGTGMDAGNDADPTRSLGNPTPPSYIGNVVAPAHPPDGVETLSACVSSCKPMLSTGRQ